MILFLRVLEFLLLLFVMIYSAYKTWDSERPYTILQAISWRAILLGIMIYNLIQGQFIIVSIYNFFKEILEN